MSLSASDIEEYFVRKTLEAGHTNPTITDVARVRFLVDVSESAIESYLEERRDIESQEQYEDLLDLIEEIKSEAL